jgi:hypothetical protein
MCGCGVVVVILVRVVKEGVVEEGGGGGTCMGAVNSPVVANNDEWLGEKEGKTDGRKAGRQEVGG